MAGREKLDALKAAMRDPPKNWRWDYGIGEPVQWETGGCVYGCALAMATHLGIATPAELQSILGIEPYRDTFIRAGSYGRIYHGHVTREMVLAKLESLTV